MTETRMPDTPADTDVLVRLVEAALAFAAVATEHMNLEVISAVQQADLVGAMYSVNVKLTPPVSASLIAQAPNSEVPPVVVATWMQTPPPRGN